jgi:hypothetical protein
LNGAFCRLICSPCSFRLWKVSAKTPATYGVSIICAVCSKACHLPLRLLLLLPARLPPAGWVDRGLMWGTGWVDRGQGSPAVPPPDLSTALKACRPPVASSSSALCPITGSGTSLSPSPLPATCTYWQILFVGLGNCMSFSIFILMRASPPLPQVLPPQALPAPPSFSTGALQHLAAQSGLRVSDPSLAAVQR